MLPILGLQ